MDHQNRIVSSVSNAVRELPELGTLLCKNCGALIGTLPTNGVKKLYSVCTDGCGERGAGKDE